MDQWSWKFFWSFPLHWHWCMDGSSQGGGNLPLNLGGGVSETPSFAVFFEGHVQNLGGERSPPKFRGMGWQGLAYTKLPLALFRSTFWDLSGESWRATTKGQNRFRIFHTFFRSRSGKPNQRKVSSWTFHRANLNQNSMWIVLVFPRKNTRIHKKGEIYELFVSAPFGGFCLPGRLLICHTFSEFSPRDFPLQNKGVLA